MVGVPGKSKGCHNCRRRKVKCDEGKPKCQRCYKSSLKCQGYQKRPVFLNRAQTGLLKRARLEEVILHTQPDTLLETILAPQISLTSVWKHKIEGCFLEKFLASDFSSQKPSPGYYVFEIMCELSRDDLLEFSVQSLCLSRMGRMNKDEKLLRQGFHAYTLAIRKLHRAMICMETQLQDNTLAAAKIMNLYEFFEPSYHCGTAVYNHTLGVERLAYLRETNGTGEPEAMKSLIRSTRYNSQEDVDGYSIESFEHTLMDIGFVIATIVRDYEYLRLQYLYNEPILDLEKFTKRCCSVHTRLETWYVKFTGRSSSPPYWTSHEEEHTLEDKIPILDFSHISVAHILIDYWALSIIIGRTSEQLSLFIKNGLSSDSIPDDGSLEPFHELAVKNCSDKQVEYGLNILASAGFCNKKEAGMAGKDHLFGLGISLRLFRMVSGPDAKALEERTIEILHQIADDGIQFARCLVQQAQSEVQEHIGDNSTLVELRWGAGYQQQHF